MKNRNVELHASACGSTQTFLLGSANVGGSFGVKQGGRFPQTTTHSVQPPISTHDPDREPFPGPSFAAGGVGSIPCGLFPTLALSGLVSTINLHITDSALYGYGKYEVFRRELTLWGDLHASAPDTQLITTMVIKTRGAVTKGRPTQYMGITRIMPLSRTFVSPFQDMDAELSKTIHAISIDKISLRAPLPHRTQESIRQLLIRFGWLESA